MIRALEENVGFCDLTSNLKVNSPEEAYGTRCIYDSNKAKGRETCWSVRPPSRQVVQQNLLTLVDEVPCKGDLPVLRFPTLLQRV